MRGHPLDYKCIRAIAPIVFPRARQETTGFQPSPGLSETERQFFCENGYLVKHSVIPAALTARAIDYCWSLLPDRFQRDRPESWRGLVEDSLCERTVAARKGRLKYRECVRRERWLYEMIDGDPCIRTTVEGLLGAGRVPPLQYIRGLYPVIPAPRTRLRVPRPHTDGHRFLVGTLTYLDDVGEGGGGFHVWPGSHLLMGRQFTTAAGAGWKDSYHRGLYQLARRSAPVEILAPRGSVIFWHHRLAHAAGINRSQAIRHALLADFYPEDYDDFCHRPVPPNPWQYWAESLQQ